MAIDQISKLDGMVHLCDSRSRQRKAKAVKALARWGLGKTASLDDTDALDAGSHHLPPADGVCSIQLSSNGSAVQESCEIEDARLSTNIFSASFQQALPPPTSQVIADGVLDPLQIDLNLSVYSLYTVPEESEQDGMEAVPKAEVNNLCLKDQDAAWNDSMASHQAALSLVPCLVKE